MRKNHQSKLFQNLCKWFLVQYFECRVILFWLVTVISVKMNIRFAEFLAYISLVIATYLVIDLLKILLAKTISL